jgi:hypothetical protein
LKSRPDGVDTDKGRPGGRPAVALSLGLRGGAILVVVAIVFGIVGLSSSFRWVPEAPLLAGFVLVQVGTLYLTGRRAGTRATSLIPGVLAGAIAGALGGCAGGLTYLAFGKPAINILVGFLAGALEGGIVGGSGAWLASRRAD